MTSIKQVAIIVFLVFKKITSNYKLSTFVVFMVKIIDELSHQFLIHDK